MAYLLYVLRRIYELMGTRAPASAFIGRTVIVGVTFIDADGKLVSQIQVPGRIRNIVGSDAGLERPDGSIFYIPPGTRAFKAARAGQYRLKSTGEIILNPDYLASWTVRDAKAENIAEYRQHGFRGGFETKR